MEILNFLIAGTLLAGTPLLIAALGALVAEKAGVLNISVEGMMAMGAVTGFVVASNTGNYELAILAGALAGACLALFFGLVVLVALGDQVATGLAVGILGMGLSGLFGSPYQSATIPPMPSLKIPGLSELPLVGGTFFSQTWPVYFAPLLAVATWWFLRSTKAGLMIRAVGESPHSANALGYNVILIRLCVVLYGGLCAGMAGAFITIAAATLWTDGIIAGRGWIVVALVVFGTWRPGRIAFGAYLFGATTLAGLLLQSVGSALPSQFFISIPYIVTIIAVSLMSLNPKRARLNTPASLGQVYHETK
jgi:general nucleoside transport system permease protein